MSKIPDEVLQELATNLSRLRPKDPERRKLVERTASIFNCSTKTVHRQLARLRGPRKYTRSDHLSPRGRTEADFKHWVELIAAVKLATRNQKGRHLSTARAIEMVEEGVYIDDRFEQVPKGALRRSNCDRWMRQLGITVRNSLRPIPAVRFEAR